MVWTYTHAGMPGRRGSDVTGCSLHTQTLVRKKKWKYCSLSFISFVNATLWIDGLNVFCIFFLKGTTVEGTGLWRDATVPAEYMGMLWTTFQDSHSQCLLRISSNVLLNIYYQSRFYRTHYLKACLICCRSYRWMFFWIIQSPLRQRHNRFRHSAPV